MVRSRVSRGQDQGDASQGTNSNSSDYSDNQNEVEILRGYLQSTSNQGEEAAVEDAVDTANAISSPFADEAPENALQVINTDYFTLGSGLGDSIIRIANATSVT